MSTFIGKDSELMKGVIEVFPQTDKFNNHLRIKLGFDPTSDRLHLGHLVLLNKIKQFQSHGHHACIIIGDFTAKVGDPTGRNETRPQLSDEEIDFNVNSILKIIKKFLDPEVEIFKNSSWLFKQTPDSLLSLMSLFTVNQMLAKEDFGNRYKDGNPIGMHEFMYPLLQGLDSLIIKSDVEIGGSDQKFNIGIGRDIQKKFNSSEKSQIGILMPILQGRDGSSKMSKSKNNTINLDDEPLEMYSKLEKIPDHIVLDYLNLLTDVPQSEYPKENRERQRFMAFKVTESIHGLDKTQEAQKISEKIVLKGQTSDDMNIPEIYIPENLEFPIPLCVFMFMMGMSTSISDSKRKIQSGAVRLNDEKIVDVEKILDTAQSMNGVILRTSRTNFKKILLKS